MNERCLKPNLNRVIKLHEEYENTMHFQYTSVLPLFCSMHKQELHLSFKRNEMYGTRIVLGMRLLVNEHKRKIRMIKIAVHIMLGR